MFPRSLDALRDKSPATRLAVLDALTRLPLESEPEHLDVIGLATRVPIRSTSTTR